MLHRYRLFLVAMLQPVVLQVMGISVLLFELLVLARVELALLVQVQIQLLLQKVSRSRRIVRLLLLWFFSKSPAMSGLFECFCEGFEFLLLVG